MIITHKHVVEDGWGWDLIASPDSQQRAGLLVLDVIVDNLGEQELVTYGGVSIAHTIDEDLPVTSDQRFMIVCDKK